MISNTCKTAIKAVVFLSSRSGNGEKIGIREIANELNASEHTVGKMLQLLVKHKLINSLKGPSGGFFITEVQQKAPIIKIVEAIDGKGVFKDCGLGLSKCSSTHPCPIHDQYKEGRDRIEQLFNQRRVIELCDPVNKGLAYLAG